MRNEEDRLNADIRRHRKQAELLRDEREDWKELGNHLRRDVVLFVGGFLLAVLVAIVVLLTE